MSYVFVIYSGFGVDFVFEIGRDLSFGVDAYVEFCLSFWCCF